MGFWRMMMVIFSEGFGLFVVFLYCCIFVWFSVLIRSYVEFVLF